MKIKTKKLFNLIFNSQYSEPYRIYWYRIHGPEQRQLFITMWPKLKTIKTKNSSDDPQMFYHSVHKADFSASICCKERWELTHYLKKSLEVNGHSQKYQADVERHQFLTY